MKSIVAIFFTLSSLIVMSQCDELISIGEKTEFEGVTIRYYRVDSTLQIQYDYKDFHNELGDRYSVPCDLTYRPGIPRAVWKNENFICFQRGCGTSCFSNYLAPLNNQYEAAYGGQFLIDTINTIFMSLYFDTLSYEPYLVLENFTTG